MDKVSLLFSQTLLCKMTPNYQPLRNLSLSRGWPHTASCHYTKQPS